MAHDEYLRRNLLHCKSLGAHGIAAASMGRLLSMKNPPRWIVEALDGILDRTAELSPEMAAWRNSAPDAPSYVSGVIPSEVPSQAGARVE